MVFMHLNLATKLDESFNDFNIVRQHKGIANVLWNPIFLCSFEILHDLPAMIPEFLSELRLQLKCHLAAAAAPRQSFSLLDLLPEQVAILHLFFLACLETATSPNHPSTAFARFFLSEQIVSISLCKGVVVTPR